MNWIKPLIDFGRLLYLRWALREIDPMHPDVPMLVLRINDLERA